MTAVDQSQWYLQRSLTGARRARNSVATVWMVGSMLVALVPLLVLVAYVVSKGAGVVSWSFLTKDLPYVTQFSGGGIGPAIAGTLVVTATAAVMAIPLGVLAAIYLNEYGK